LKRNQEKIAKKVNGTPPPVNKEDPMTFNHTTPKSEFGEKQTSAEDTTNSKQCSQTSNIGCEKLYLPLHFVRIKNPEA